MAKLREPKTVQRLTRAALAEAVNTLETRGKSARPVVTGTGRDQLRGWLHSYFTDTDQGQKEWQQSHHYHSGRTLDSVLDDIMQGVPDDD